MDFGIVNIGLLVLAALFILVAAKVLLHRDWLFQFLRGFCGFFLLGLALLSVLISLNIATYAQLNNGQTLARISFTQTATQEFDATITDVATGNKQSFSLYGDMWQVSARNLQVMLVDKGFYQLNNLKSRYYALEQENSSSHSYYDLYKKSIGFDLWQALGGGSIGLLSAAYLIGNYVPMADGAEYVLTVNNQGLQVGAVNDAANKALGH